MKTLYILLIAISMPVAGMTQGNNYFSQPCYTDELWKQACAKDVTLATKRLQMDMLFSEHVNKGLDKPQRSHRSLTDGVITIPVVIYIVHDGATASNISMQAIQSQIDQLNEDFLSYGISFCYANRNVVDATFFTPAAGDSAGVFRINSPLTNLDIATQDIQLKQLSTLSSKNYLRIFVVNNLSPQGVAGYAFFPGGNDLTDGIVVQANVFGSNNFCAGCPLLSNYNLGHVLTHEVGHYLDLYHTFQGGCDTTNINPLVPACTVTGDWICDTPPTTGNFGCPQPAPLSCNSSTPIMVQNYMDYTNDLCRNSFTTGQNNRMHTAINAYRHLLVSPANLLKTGVQCIDLSHNFADFNCSNFNGCIGRAMGFGALGGTDFTYTWNFGNGNTATGDTVVTTYIAAGQYPVTLTATHNITGVVYTKSQTVFITACYPNTCDRNKLNSGLNFLDFSTGNAVAVSHRRDNQDWPLCTYYQSFTRGDGHGNDFVTINWVNNNLHEVLDSAWNAVDTLGYGLSAYMFPVPGHVNMHCFMHTPWFYNGNIHTAWHDTIAYSIIGNNNGIPYVLPGKKSILLPVAGKTDQRIPFGKVAIIPGCNGTQNWIITVIDDSTLNIMTIDSSATIQLHSIYHPANLRVFSLYSSPNGKRLAVNSFTKNPPITGGTMIFDFNKSTGALTPTNQFIYRGGNCFSPNSRFLYSVSPCCNPEVTTIYQHDLNSLDINASALKVYEFPTDSSNWAGATLFNGADAKTYIGFSRHGNNDADDFRMGL
ncbi:MAG TPA: M43 family zinc metalloprotease, partial [Chitinophagales bacterium]|nr:M43 family zinc metalloprotease [Chitinophagales bacterium]